MITMHARPRQIDLRTDGRTSKQREGAFILTNAWRAKNGEIGQRDFDPDMYGIVCETIQQLSVYQSTIHLQM